MALASAGAAERGETVAPKAQSSRLAIGLPANWRQLRKFDAHHHVFLAGRRSLSDWSEVDNLIEAADHLGIERLFCSRPITAGVRVNIDVVRDANDSVLDAMKRHPGRIGGYCFVQPGNGAAALDEIERTLAAGMIGVKLYNQYNFTDPIIFPIAEKCLLHRIPLLGHSGHLTDPKARAAQPRISDALDFCALARRYPTLPLILGHVNGGGDWEWAIRGIRECPQIYLDTSGSGLDDDTIGRCVRAVGPDRVLFATDGTMEGCVGKILSADLTAAQREAILWRNWQRVLDQRLT